MADPTPDITVVICTYNRAMYVQRALGSLLRQTLPRAQFEVFVVDNRSTDNTRDVAIAYGRQMGNLTYAYEKRAGLSYARNRGLREAHAPIVAFLDDDAIANPGWLEDLVMRFNTIRPRPACVGGPVTLDWEGPPPDWLPDAYRTLYTHLDLGDELRRLDDDDAFLQGANMAFDAATLEREGRFNPKLGRVGTSLLSGEETELIMRLKERHLGVYYSPGAGVHHLVLPERRTPKFFRRRLVYDGKSQVAMALLRGDLTRDELPRRLAYDAKVLAAHVAGYVGHRLTGNRERATHLRYQIPRRFGRVSMLIQELRKR